MFGIVDAGIARLEAEKEFSKLCIYGKLVMEFALKDVKKDPMRATEILNEARLKVIERMYSHISDVETMSDPTKTDGAAKEDAGKEEGQGMDFEEENVTTKETAQEMVEASRRNSVKIDNLTEDQKGERNKRKISYLLEAMNTKRLAMERETQDRWSAGASKLMETLEMEPQALASSIEGGLSENELAVQQMADMVDQLGALTDEKFEVVEGNLNILRKEQAKQKGEMVKQKKENDKRFNAMEINIAKCSLAIDTVVPGVLTEEDQKRMEDHHTSNLLHLPSAVPEVERNLKLPLDKHKYYLAKEKLQEMKIEKGPNHKDTGKPFQFQDIKDFEDVLEVAEYMCQRGMRRLIFTPLPVDCWTSENIHDGMMSKHMFNPAKMFGARQALYIFMTKYLKLPKKATVVMKNKGIKISVEDILKDVVYIMPMPGQDNTPFKGVFSKHLLVCFVGRETVDLLLRHGHLQKEYKMLLDIQPQMRPYFNTFMAVCGAIRKENYTELANGKTFKHHANVRWREDSKGLKVVVKRSPENDWEDARHETDVSPWMSEEELKQVKVNVPVDQMEAPNYRKRSDQKGRDQVSFKGLGRGGQSKQKLVKGEFKTFPAKMPGSGAKSPAPTPFGLSKKALKKMDTPPGKRRRKEENVNDDNGQFDDDDSSDGSAISDDEVSKMTEGEIEAELKKMEERRIVEEKRRAKFDAHMKKQKELADKAAARRKAAGSNSGSKGSRFECLRDDTSGDEDFFFQTPPSSRGKSTQKSTPFKEKYVKGNSSTSKEQTMSTLVKDKPAPRILNLTQETFDNDIQLAPALSPGNGSRKETRRNSFSAGFQTNFSFVSIVRSQGSKTIIHCDTNNSQTVSEYTRTAAEKLLEKSGAFIKGVEFKVVKESADKFLFKLKPVSKINFCNVWLMMQNNNITIEFTKNTEIEGITPGQFLFKIIYIFPQEMSDNLSEFGANLKDSSRTNVEAKMLANLRCGCCNQQGDKKGNTCNFCLSYVNSKCKISGTISVCKKCPSITTKWISCRALVDAIIEWCESELACSANAPLGEVVNLKGAAEEERRKMMDESASPVLSERKDDETPSVDDKIKDMAERKKILKRDSRGIKKVSKKNQNNNNVEEKVRLAKIGSPYVLGADVAKLGECFYESIEVLMREEGENAGAWSSADYRALTVAKAEEVLKEAGLFHLFFQTQDQFIFEKERQAERTTWASSGWIQALSLILKRNIVMIADWSRPEKPFEFVVGASATEKGKRPLRLLYVDNCHYRPLFMKPTATTRDEDVFIWSYVSRVIEDPQSAGLVNPHTITLEEQTEAGMSKEKMDEGLSKNLDATGKEETELHDFNKRRRVDDNGNEGINKENSEDKSKKRKVPAGEKSELERIRELLNVSDKDMKDISKEFLVTSLKSALGLAEFEKRQAEKYTGTCERYINQLESVIIENNVLDEVNLGEYEPASLNYLKLSNKVDKMMEMLLDQQQAKTMSASSLAKVVEKENCQDGVQILASTGVHKNSEVLTEKNPGPADVMTRAQVTGCPVTENTGSCQILIGSEASTEVPATMNDCNGSKMAMPTLQASPLQTGAGGASQGKNNGNNNKEISEFAKGNLNNLALGMIMECYCEKQECVRDRCSCCLHCEINNVCKRKLRMENLHETFYSEYSTAAEGSTVDVGFSGGGVMESNDNLRDVSVQTNVSHTDNLSLQDGNFHAAMMNAILTGGLIDITDDGRVRWTKPSVKSAYYCNEFFCNSLGMTLSDVKNYMTWLHDELEKEDERLRNKLQGYLKSNFTLMRIPDEGSRNKVNGKSKTATCSLLLFQPLMPLPKEQSPDSGCGAAADEPTVSYEQVEEILTKSCRTCRDKAEDICKQNKLGRDIEEDLEQLRGHNYASEYPPLRWSVDLWSFLLKYRFRRPNLTGLNLEKTTLMETDEDSSMISPLTSSPSRAGDGASLSFDMTPIEQLQVRHKNVSSFIQETILQLMDQTLEENLSPESVSSSIYSDDDERLLNDQQEIEMDDSVLDRMAEMPYFQPLESINKVDHESLTELPYHGCEDIMVAADLETDDSFGHGMSSSKCCGFSTFTGFCHYLNGKYFWNFSGGYKKKDKNQRVITDFFQDSAGGRSITGVRLRAKKKKLQIPKLLRRNGERSTMRLSTLKIKGKPSSRNLTKDCSMANDFANESCNYDFMKHDFMFPGAGSQSWL